MIEKVVKRDSTMTEDFDFEKVKGAINKALTTNGYEARKSFPFLEMRLKLMHGTRKVEDIQDLVEKYLLSRFPLEVARSYILYREDHKNARFLSERIDYMKRYMFENKNASSSSETDPNANLAVKNVANLTGEMYKTKSRLVLRYTMKRKLQEMYPEVANQYRRDIESHIIYIHDETQPVPINYCEAVSLYPLIQNGTGQIDGLKSGPPKNLSSFAGQFVNLMFMLASQCKGAVACLHGSQKLLVNNEFVAIKDFVNSNWQNPQKYEDWEYCDVTDKDYHVYENGRFVKVKKVFRKKYSDRILTVTSSSGYTAKVSKDHKFKVFEGGVEKEVPAEKLKKYDTVFVNPEIPIDFNSREYKEGWIKGMLLGDGCLTQPNMVSLSVNYDQEYYGDIFNAYSTELYGEALHKNAGHKCYNYQTHIRDYSKKLKEGITGKGTFDKNIEWRDNIHYLAGVLDGLLCADGGDHHSIVLSLVNKNIIDTVKRILDLLNVKYSYKEIPEHDNKSRLYKLNINSTVMNFTQNLWLKIPKKNCKFIYRHSGYANFFNKKSPEWIISNGDNRFLFPSYKTDVITSITEEPNDDKYVYEIETESHWYNCGGFITHNCGEFFNFLDYFCAKDFGEDYHKNPKKVVMLTPRRTIRDMLHQYYQQIVYAMNQPMGSRAYSSPFINVSYYDSNYWHSLFDDFCFPDGSKPVWARVSFLQKDFMQWFNEERTKTLLTFPVGLIGGL